ncbi:hypothetical protein BGZ70_001098 [Mortierella alpina]|uniref:RRM domain-containing protein n=1 Tax=Mortierella alpina TaxID=64518 RepID=A0A9P6IYE6_MORAP|nr:hypothetical protein BGZ70_001098 [Mortierella alpina]
MANVQAKATSPASVPKDSATSSRPTARAGAASIHTIASLHSILLARPGSEDTSGHFFMKPLTAAPDYRFNLYVKGLAPTTTTRSLFDLFKPYGDILACKTILDNDTGFCKGGFVLFDNQESCTEARRALTQQGLYVTVAHESVSIKSLPAAQHVPSKPTAVVPKIDNSDDFPSLPSKPSSKKQPHKGTLNSSPKLESVNQCSASSLPATQNKEPEVDDGAGATTTIEDSLRLGFSTLSQSSERLSTTLSLGQSYLDFDGGFIGSHQQFLSEGYSHAAEYQRRPSFLEHKWGVEDIDRYMNMLELNTSVVEPQPSSNLNNARRQPSIGGAHISKTTIDDFVLEERPRRASSLYFDDLPEGFTYLKLFELCAQYGSLVLTSVDIRYINADCCGVGKVTFESHADSEVAFSSLSGLNYKVRKEYDDIHSRDVGIDEHLYDQYYQQHMDILKQGDRSAYESPDDTLQHPLEHGYYSAQTSLGPFTPLRRESNDHYTLDPWGSPTSEFGALDNNLPRWQAGGFVADVDNGAGTLEKPSMLRTSPFPSSLSPASSSSASSALLQGWSQSPSPAPTTEYPVHEAGSAACRSTIEAQYNQHSINAPVAPRDLQKTVSYSDAVKVPTKPRVSQTTEGGRSVQASPPQQDLKRRGNTNKSLDEQEYQLNLYLKDLEPTMDEYRLYEICVQFGPVISCRTITTHNGVCTGLGFVMYTSNDSVSRAIEGLRQLGYHAEVAIPSATNKLRCKVKSDTLFLQNIPPNIKEGKIRDLFRPYVLLACNILRDTKSGKGRGVAFLKMKDVSTAERFIEEYHGRVLGKDWKLPLQVSPAKQSQQI